MTSRSNASKKATDLLARNNLSAAQLRARLAQRGYDADEIEPAISMLEKRHFLNDASSAHAKALQWFHKRYGPAGVRHKLEAAEFSAETIDCAMTEVMRELQYNETLAAKECLSTSGKTGAKAMRFLQSRGYGEEVISSLAIAVAEMAEED